MSAYERFVLVFARVATLAFVATTFTTFTGIYGWLHPGLWGIQLVSFLVIEGGFYYIRGSRTKVDMAVALALWASVGAWVSIEHFAVLVSVIVVLRALPDGTAFRICAAIMVAGIASLVTLADINPWSETAPGKSWLHDLFFASCLLNIALVILRASLPKPRTS